MNDSEAIVKCPECGREIGCYKPNEGAVWLKIGPLLIRVLRAKCDCGFEFDFDVSTKRLEDLIERIKNK